MSRRILMLLENCHYTVDGRVIRESRALTEAGYQVTVICPRGKGEPWTMDCDGVRVVQYTLPCIGAGWLGFFLEYAWAMTATLLLSIYVLLRYGFDVVHAHNPPDFFVAIVLLYKPLGKRFVFDHHDLAPEMYSQRFARRGMVYRLLLFFERLSCRVADHIITTNHSFKQIEMERCGIASERITVVRNGPEEKHLASAAPHESLRDEQRTVIGFVGEMGPLDGVDLLLRSLHRLREDLHRDDWLAVLVGDGESFDSLKRAAQELGIDGQVRFVGRVPFEEVTPYIAAMDLCAIPDPPNEYTRRCTLIKTMEYMAQSKPIVAFDLKETRFSAQDGAVYVLENDESAFARAIAELMDDADLRRAMGLAGRRRVETELTWRHSIPHLLSVYAALAAPDSLKTPKHLEHVLHGNAGD
jgi:glycosyltransferase involved in cell wall biosynthesis